MKDGRRGIGGVLQNQMLTRIGLGALSVLILTAIPGGLDKRMSLVAAAALLAGLAVGGLRRRGATKDIPTALVASLPDGVAILDNEDRITWATDRFAALTGYDRDSLFHMPFLDLFRNDSLEILRVHRPVRRLGAIGPSLDVLVTRRNGAELPVQLAFSPLSDAGICLVMTEQTVRRAAEAALERSEARFHMVFENASMGMAYLEGGGVVAANQALGAMLGCAPETLEGHDLLALISGRLSSPTDRFAEDSTEFPGNSAADTTTTTTVAAGVADEYQVSLPGAAVEWVRISLSGEGGGAVALVEDITDAKAIEAQLKHVDRLSQLGELAASLAHEIGQPLNVIRLTAEGALDRLHSAPLDVARQTRGLGVVLDQADRLQQIIDHTLSYSRRGNEPASLIDPRPVISAAVAFVGRRFNGQAVRLNWQPPARVAQVFGHPVRLEQVVTNLLNNACDAVLTGRPNGQSPGGVTILCRFDEETAQLVISVADDGPGVPDAVRNRLFEPFFTTKSQGKGTGLGLAVSLGIVSEMGGTIEVTNLHPGVRFDVLLPAQDPVEEQLPLASAAVPETPEVGLLSDFSNTVSADLTHVLVVDDEHLAVGEISAFLAGRGYRVSMATGGHAALATFLADPADVVVTDLNMPEGDGVTLIRRLKAKHPQVPVIAFTVLAGDVPGQALAAGASLVLPKPLGLAEIDACIQALLAETRQLSPASPPLITTPSPLPGQGMATSDNELLH